MLYLKRGFINALKMANDAAEGKKPTAVETTMVPPTQATGVQWVTTNGVTYPAKLQQFFKIFSAKEALNILKNSPLDSIKWAHKDDSIWIVLGEKDGGCVVPDTQAFRGQEDAIWHIYWLFKHFINAEAAIEIVEHLRRKMKGVINV